MKQTIRRCTWETNSSSTHSLQICTKSEFEEFEKGKTFIFDGYFYSKKTLEKPIRGKFYTLKEALEILSKSEYYNENWKEEYVDAKSYLRENEFYDYDYFFEDSHLEYFQDSYTTPGGEQIVAFGKYGNGY